MEKYVMSDLPAKPPKNLKPAKSSSLFSKIHIWIAETAVIIFAIYELLKFAKYLYISW